MTTITILKTIQEVRVWHKQNQLKSVGFVPTMGALHSGHLGLVKQSKQQSDLTIVSIFVNPSQFAPTEDLDKYPRDVDSDIKKLEGLADAVFLPSVEEMYPSGITLNVNSQVGTFVEVLGKSHQLEGSIRPHFFRGVATIVSKLLNIVQPDFLYLGQKDAQQCVVVKNLIKDLCFNTKAVLCPIAREENGLAMSSRNQYLSQETKEKEALALYKALCSSEALFKQGVVDRESLLNEAKKIIQEFKEVELEYVRLSDPITLDEVEQVTQNGALLSGAIKVGPTGKTVRLIDNVMLGGSL
ncbi:Pantoate-beta-alanine ligase [Neoconidiobolus thromboides FSU 785]|nr:Pantoate-beta-alanine ligase [Neoconidiobolus thromboides FSU 785]